MPHFRYTALHDTGETRRGYIDALSQDAALILLRKEALTPTQIHEVGKVVIRLDLLQKVFARARGLGLRDVLSITQQLAALLKSGLTLDRALSVGADLAAGKEQKRFYIQVLGMVRRGLSFTEALRHQEVQLPSYYLGMVRAGEAGGSLPQALARLSALLEQAHRTRERIISALIYPAILLLTIGGSLTMIVSFVLPRFEALFAEAGSQLPLPTRAVMWFGGIARNEGWLILLGLIVAIAGSQRALRQPALRLSLDRWLLTRGLYARTLGKAESARFGRTLGMLLNGGMPLPLGFKIAIGSLRNTALVRSSEQVLEGISAGKDMAAQLHRLGGFPPLLLQLVRVGLETGRLADCLQEAADILDEESRQAIDRSVSVIVPLVTVLMGALVAALIGSVLAGILSLNDLAG